MPHSGRAILSLLFLITVVSQPIATAEGDVMLSAVAEEQFAALKKNSPFSRVLNLEDTYVLRGIATIENVTHITLQHRQTKKTISVNSATENREGMKLLTVIGTKPEEMEVKLSFAGSEFGIAYEASALNPKSAAPTGTNDTIRRDREGRIITSEELIKKWHSLSKEQRQKYDQWKQKLLHARPGLRHSEKRFPIAHKALDAFKAGRKPPNF